MNGHERAHMLGSGALAGVLGLHLPGLDMLPPDVRSAVWGAIGAALVGLIARGGQAFGEVVRASGRRVAVWIDPRGAAVVEVSAARESSEPRETPAGGA